MTLFRAGPDVDDPKPVPLGLIRGEVEDSGELSCVSLMVPSDSGVVLGLFEPRRRRPRSRGPDADEVDIEVMRVPRPGVVDGNSRGLDVLEGNAPRDALARIRRA